MFKNKIWVKNVQSVIKNNKIVFVSIVFIILGLMLRIWDAQPVLYAHAYTMESENVISKTQFPLADTQNQLFAKNGSKTLLANSGLYAKNKEIVYPQPANFANKIYAVVGEYPIKEMVPFISKRNEKVAAFLIGIAKKESGFGEHSPSLDGKDCYNYWGYKGSAGRGSSMGYACFASAQEAVETVGNRIEVLVNKDRNTPTRMVNTWKCGTSCAGDAGASGWVSTVALYFDKIVS